MDIKVLAKEEISLEEVLANKLVIKCETRKEAERITNMANIMGLVWVNGDRMIYNHYWDVHKQDTCYDLSLGACDKLSRYVAQDRVIIDSTRVTNIRLDPEPTQVGSDHYQAMVIQPIEFILKNNLNFAQGNVIKYICRYKHKNGLEDLLKARDYIDYLIKEEYPD